MMTILHPHGGKFLSEDLGIKLEKVELDDLAGQAHHHRQGKYDHRRRQWQAVRCQAGSTNSTASKRHQRLRREKLQERLAKLAAAWRLLRRRSHRTEMKEKKARVETRCTRPARLSRKHCPGGGTALIRAIPALDELRLKATRRLAPIVKRALEEPLRQLLTTPAGSSLVVRAEGRKAGRLRRDKLEYWTWASGIIDPTKSLAPPATRVEHRCLLLTTDAVSPKCRKRKGPMAASAAAWAWTTKPVVIINNRGRGAQ